MIRKAIDPRMIATTVSELTTFHRITASEQMNGAAEHAAKLLRDRGVSASTWSFPSSTHDYIGSSPTCDTWECRSGWCELVDEPGHHIADYQAMPLSVLCESCSCDYSNDPIQVIVLDKGPEEEKYADINFEKTMILIPRQVGHYFNIRAYTDWAYRRGCVGHFLSAVATEENVRGIWNQYDTVAWSRVYSHDKFGFGITPREGDRLTTLYYQKQAKGEKLLVHCFIDAYNSNETNTMTNAMGVVKGETDEEILLYAHLCHPRPSANDNISGCSSVMEAIRALNDLVSRGYLPKPKRTIRAMVGPEMFGSLAWADHLGKEGRKKVVGAICLDMVGAKQGHMGVGPVFLQNMPLCSPGCSFDVASLCLDEIMKDTSYGDGSWYCTHNLVTAEYSGGSDHDILNDPGVGFCCTYMGQWPDRFYHSSSDSPENVDPTLIARSSGVSAAFAYLLATLTTEDLPDIMAKSVQNISKNLVTRKVNEDIEMYGQSMRFFRDFYWQCADGFLKLLPGDEKAAEAVSTHKEHITSLVNLTASARAGRRIDVDTFDPYTVECDDKYQCIISKNFLGRVIILDWLHVNHPNGRQLIDEFNKEWGEKLKGCGTITLFHCDGKRSLAQACTLAAIERAQNPNDLFEPMYQYMLLLEKLKVVTIKRN